MTQAFPGPRKTAALLLLMCISTVALSLDRVASVTFEGLQKTRPDFLQTLISTQPGRPFDPSMLEEDLRLLRKLRLFSRVECSVSESEQGKRVIFELQEVNTLLPILDFGGIKDNLWFQVGLNQHNLLGRGQQARILYRYNGEHSGSLFWQAPYLVSGRWGLSIGLSRFSSIESVTYRDWDHEYRMILSDASITIGHFFNTATRLELGAHYLTESYHSTEATDNPEIPTDMNYKKWLFKGVLTLNRLDYGSFRLSGFFNRITLECVKTLGETALFWKGLNISTLFFRSGNRGNVAFRLRAGLSTHTDTPFVPFVLDSYINVRGSGNRVARGTAELTLNAEYRHILLNSSWGGFQAVWFLDWSSWRPPTETLLDMFRDANTVSFTGLGVRVHLHRWYHLVLRLDIGMNLTRTRSFGVVLGAGQYF